VPQTRGAASGPAATGNRLQLGPQANRTAFLPNDAEKKRLRFIASEHRIAEGIVVAYAASRMFGALTDEEIVAQIRAQGHGMRRSRGSAA